MTEHATGARHPILARELEAPWELGELRAWMTDVDPTECYDPSEGPFVVLLGADGQEVTIPRALLGVLARGIAAAHVDAGRTDRWPR